MNCSLTARTNVFNPQRFSSILLAFVILLTVSTTVYAQPADFADELVSTGFNKAEGLTFDYQGRIYIWEKRGTVSIIENGSTLPDYLIDIQEEVANHNDHGLNGFALDPNFQSNGYIYLLYSVDRHHLMNYGTPAYNSNSNDYNKATISRLTRYTADPADDFNSVIPGSRVILIGDSVHNGIPMLGTTHSVGSLVFGTDGTLMVCSGDMYFHELAPNNYEQQALADGIIDTDEVIGPWRAQYLGSMNGKILRVDPATGDGIPSNPFYDAGNPRSAQSRTWALGLRNPFRMTIQPETGSHNPNDGDPGIFFVGDVGFSTWEETSIIDGPGQNFGWPLYEGITDAPSYVATEPYNMGAPTPSGCAQPYYKFSDLLSDDGTWPDPCNPGQQIPASQYHLFTYKKPIFDYKHSTDISRVVVNGTMISMNSNASYGTPFSGNAAIGGVFYEGTDFPTEWRGYYAVDFGEGWIKHVELDQSYNPVKITNFLDITGSIPAIGISPTEPGIFYIDFFEKELRKITYMPANLPPIAQGTADKIYGTSPLTVQFDASGSSDPDNDPMTYTWDFKDGSPLVHTITPVHVFTAPSSAPAQFDVVLTITDDDLEKDSMIITISLNNTPPKIISTSLDNVHYFDMSGNSIVPLNAVVTDAEHGPSDLEYHWITSLRHFNHEHEEAEDMNASTSTVLTPVGCDGIMYFYRIYLTVKDKAGLSASLIRDIYPNCLGPVGRSDFNNYVSGQSTILNILNNDLPYNGNAIDPTTVAIVDAPQWGSVSINPLTGQVTYTHNGGAETTDWFSYTVNDIFGTPSAVIMATLADGQSGSSFPVEYLSVNAYAKGDHVDIEWVTSSETNNDFFTVERSADGRVFWQIAQIDGKGTVQTPSAYKSTDSDPLPGTSYYRLRQTDLNGHMSFSSVMEVNIDPKGLGMNLKSVPNPVEYGNDFSVDFMAAETRPVYLQIFDLNGKQIQSSNYSAIRGVNRITLSSETLTPGIYFIRLSNYFQSETAKVIVR
ncbi:MAG: PQQ-dependent sugar dehydrogenase [Bacteroidia bacterium]|nr:PQQ-dependent sugar dehydrogenase [Bacteroidia bacterium]